MAGKVNKWKRFLNTPVGRVLELIAYAVMLLLVLVYFTGNGVFIYEAF